MRTAPSLRSLSTPTLTLDSRCRLSVHIYSSTYISPLSLIDSPENALYMLLSAPLRLIHLSSFQLRIPHNSRSTPPMYSTVSTQPYAYVSTTLVGTAKQLHAYLLTLLTLTLVSHLYEQVLVYTLANYSVCKDLPRSSVTLAGLGLEGSWHETSVTSRCGARGVGLREGFIYTIYTYINTPNTQFPATCLRPHYQRPGHILRKSWV